MAEQMGLHNIILENRKKVLLTGVHDVLGFSDDTINAVTELGEITLRGSNMKINNFNADKGELSAEGSIVAIVYTGDSAKGGFFSRLFK